MVRHALPVLVLLLGAAPLAQAAVFTDAFDRSDFTDLGPGWTGVSGGFRVENNSAHAASTHSVAVAATAGSATPQLSADVYAVSGTNGNHVALVSLYADPSNHIYVKVQDNDADGQFESVGFFHGSVSNGWSGISGGNAFFTLATPFSAGRIRTTVVGDQISLDIDRDADGEWDESHTRGGIPSEGLGTGIGIRGYGNGRLDNFISNVPIPEPSTFALAFAAVSCGWIRRRWPS